jgi:hypothetical protein
MNLRLEAHRKCFLFKKNFIYFISFLVKIETTREVSYSQNTLKPSQTPVSDNISQLTEGINFDEDFETDTTAMDDSILSV